MAPSAWRTYHRSQINTRAIEKIGLTSRRTRTKCTSATEPLQMGRTGVVVFEGTEITDTVTTKRNSHRASIEQIKDNLIIERQHGSYTKIVFVIAYIENFGLLTIEARRIDDGRRDDGLRDIGVLESEVVAKDMREITRVVGQIEAIVENDEFHDTLTHSSSLPIKTLYLLTLFVGALRRFNFVGFEFF